MSSPVLTNPQPGAYRKPRPDLYTVLLAIALVALIGAIVFLYLEMQRFEFDLKPPTPTTVSKWQPLAPGGFLFAHLYRNIYI
ncbi:MAG: hypothetical protein NZ602_12765 [Thermoguttaceae bacterium]|nr:hypothetical protein [Thermoguttaceae bacterium]MDW8038817.1 hypothetical protein [Thermoguttaceae bacterium]